jgi:hypothetical protein
MSETARQWDDGADYYSTSDDDERLTHEDIDECICECLEGRDGTIEEAVTKGLTVHAFKRDAIDVDDEATTQLDRFIENMSEEILEEYGDLDGSSENVFGDEAEEAFRAAVRPALKTLIAKVVVWQCNAVGERTFTPEELLAWVRENEPEWLEEKS